MKTIIGIVAIIIVGIIAFVMWTPESSAPSNTTSSTSTTEESANESNESVTRQVVTEGVYEVQAEESTIFWAGKKPLIEGYVNRGSIGATDGTIEVEEDTATGIFTMDMNTLSVSETPTKPGSENALEGHLKGESWFDVENHPEASFAITEVETLPDSETTFQYNITGELTMKGVTETLSFPATIYADENDTLYAEAEFEFDRTRWGITFGSDSFFNNLADNAIDDMVSLSFNLVAEKQ